MTIDNDKIYINDYLNFSKMYGTFQLSDMAKEILYREKEVICSYSGCNDWAHDFFCQLLDLYSGRSKYNYSIGTVDHKDSIAQFYANDHGEQIVNWIKEHKNEMWFMQAAGALAHIIRDVPKQ